MARSLFNELTKVFLNNNKSEECNFLVAKLAVFEESVTNVEFELFGRATLLTIAQIAIRMVHLLEEDDAYRMLLVLLRNDLLIRDFLVYIALNTEISIATFVTKYTADILQLSPHQKALLAKYAVLAHKCDQSSLDEDLFRALNIIYTNGCTAGPYATLRNLFLSGACNHKTRYGNCLGTRIIEYSLTESSKQQRMGDVFERAMENYFPNTGDRQKLDLSMLSSCYFLLKDIVKKDVWQDVLLLPPVDTYLDMRSTDSFHRHLHTFFMQNETSLYLLAGSALNSNELSSSILRNFAGIFTLFSSDLAKNAIVSLVMRKNSTLFETDIHRTNYHNLKLPEARDTYSLEPSSKRNPPLVPNDEQVDQTLPDTLSADIGVRDYKLLNSALNEDNYNAQVADTSEANLKQFTSSYHHSYLFMAGAVRGLEPVFFNEITMFIYCS